jgi:hypothetical protein
MPTTGAAGASLRLPRQIEHFGRLVDHILNVNDSPQLRQTLGAHFERLDRYRPCILAGGGSRHPCRRNNQRRVRRAAAQCGLSGRRTPAWRCEFGVSCIRWDTVTASTRRNSQGNPIWYSDRARGQSLCTGVSGTGTTARAALDCRAITLNIGVRRLQKTGFAMSTTRLFLLPKDGKCLSFGSAKLKTSTI